MKSNQSLEELILEVVENQLNENDPPFVKEAFLRLVGAGNEEQEAKKKITAVLIYEMNQVMKTRGPYDAKRYQEKLLELQ